MAEQHQYRRGLEQVRSIAARSGTDINAMNHIIDVVDDALAQPTPSAEPCGRCGGTGYQGDGPDALGVPCPDCTAAPPSIADMAPGTTFVWNPYRWGVARRWEVREDDDRCSVHRRRRRSKVGPRA
jgi:hypothetical protein